MKLSELQLRIIGSLIKQPSDTQEELADRLDTQQPSISRAMRFLLENNLVKKNLAGQYAPTELGTYAAQDQAVSVERKLDPAVVTQLQETIRYLNRQLFDFQKGLSGIDILTKQAEATVRTALKPIYDMEQLQNRFIEPMLTLSRSIRLIDQSLTAEPWIPNIVAVYSRQLAQSLDVNHLVSEVLKKQQSDHAAMLQQFRELTRGVDKITQIAAAQLAATAVIQVLFEQQGTFKKLFEAIEHEKNAVEAFQAAGWPIAPSMPRSLIRRVVELHSQGKSAYASQTILGYYRRENHAHLVEVLENWRQYPLFQPRMHILEDAFWAHRQGKYTLSVPVLITQIEGIMWEYVAVNKLEDSVNGIKQLYSAVVGDTEDYAFIQWSMAETLLFQLNNNVYSSTRLQEEIKRSISKRKKNRHTISHGVNPAYNQEHHSLRLFLLLDALSALKEVASSAAGARSEN